MDSLAAFNGTNVLKLLCFLMLHAVKDALKRKIKLYRMSIVMCKYLKTLYKVSHTCSTHIHMYLPNEGKR